jgi:hypothetical protein
MYKIGREGRRLRESMRGHYIEQSRWCAMMACFNREFLGRDRLCNELAASGVDEWLLPEPAPSLPVDFQCSKAGCTPVVSRSLGRDHDFRSSRAIASGESVPNARVGHPCPFHVRSDLR